MHNVKKERERENDENCIFITIIITITIIIIIIAIYGIVTLSLLLKWKNIAEKKHDIHAGKEKIVKRAVFVKKKRKTARLRVPFLWLCVISFPYHWRKQKQNGERKESHTPIWKCDDCKRNVFRLWLRLFLMIAIMIIITTGD